MKQHIVRHGEVLLKQVASLPKQAKLEKEMKKEIIAHSETGHHHVLEAIKPFKIWTWKDERYIEVPELAELWHQKEGKDAHAPHKIVPGLYKINIKKHFDYFKGALERVRD
jgi:hypothetical protein